MTLKSGILSGALAGIIWGWASMLANSFTGVTVFEGSFAHNIVSFTFAGGVFGIVAGGLLSVIGSFLPFKGVWQKAIAISAGLWLVLRLAGEMLSKMEPDRFHLVTPESIQGLLLAVLLGIILAAVSTKDFKEAV